MKNIVIIVIILILVSLLFLRKRKHTRRDHSSSPGNRQSSTLNLQLSRCDKTKCPSQLCGVVHENSNVGKDSEDCCPEGTLSTIDRGMRRFCYGLDDGKDCFEDGMCKSNYCEKILDKNGKPILGSGICKHYASCNVDDDCPNRACGRLTAADDEPKICCPSGETYRYPIVVGLDYCTKMPKGSICWSDYMCESLACKDTPESTKGKGVCL